MGNHPSYPSVNVRWNGEYNYTPVSNEPPLIHCYSEHSANEENGFKLIGAEGVLCFAPYDINPEKPRFSQRPQWEVKGYLWIDGFYPVDTRDFEMTVLNPMPVNTLSYSTSDEEKECLGTVLIKITNKNVLFKLRIFKPPAIDEWWD